MKTRVAINVFGNHVTAVGNQLLVALVLTKSETHGFEFSEYAGRGLDRWRAIRVDIKLNFPSLHSSH